MVPGSGFISLLVIPAPATHARREFSPIPTRSAGASAPAKHVGSVTNCIVDKSAAQFGGKACLPEGRRESMDPPVPPGLSTRRVGDKPEDDKSEG